MNNISYHSNLSKNILAAIIIFFNFSANLGNDIYLPSIPHLTQVFSTSPNIIQLTMTAWFAGIAFPQLFFGPLSDFLGRKPVLLGGSVCFVVATLFCIISPSVKVFILARFFQGVGVCCLNVTSYSIFTDIYEAHKRITVLNIMTAFSSLSPLLGPIIGGYLFTWFGWKANFMFIGLLSAICLIGLCFTLLESNLELNSHALKIDHLFKNYFSFLKNKLFLQNVIPYCLLLGGVVTYLTASPFIFIAKLNVSPQLFGYIQVPIFLAYLAGTVLIYLLRNKVYFKNILNVGLTMTLCSGIAMLILLLFTNQIFLSIIVCMMIYSLGFSLSSAPFIAKILSINMGLKGYTSALLGFGMAMSCVTCVSALSIFYKGVLSFALLMTIISIFSFCFYFFTSHEINSL